MNQREAWIAFVHKLRVRMPNLSEVERREWHNSFHYISAENTDEIPTDLERDQPPQFRRALNGRYWIFCKLQLDAEYWYDYNEGFTNFSGHFLHEPAIIATALGFRPKEHHEWETVEAWSWVFRHALMHNISVDDFEGWCACQTPDNSRASVLTELMRSGHIETLSSDDGPTIFDAAIGNA